jgi:hypothetical protein
MRVVLVKAAGVQILTVRAFATLLEREPSPE